VTPLPSFYALPPSRLHRGIARGFSVESLRRFCTPYAPLPIPCSLPMRGPSLTLGWGSVTLAMENASKSAWSG
jgi:hypothetical protein